MTPPTPAPPPPDLMEHLIVPLNGATGSVVCTCGTFQWDFVGGWDDLLLVDADMWGAFWKHRAGATDVEPYDMRIMVRALYTSGLTDDMNPVERRKAALRLRASLRAHRSSLLSDTEASRA